MSYDVRITDGVLDPENRALIEAGSPGSVHRVRRFVVVDANIHALYGRDIHRYLDSNDCDYELCVLPASEEAKNMQSVLTLVQGLDSFGISRRNEPIIGIGGGIILDVVGLASSLYRRSTPYIRVPTSLLGLVDAGVGIKTGVNFNGHKNRLGSYFAPSVALLDRGFLATLGDRYVSNGLAEILKISLVLDAHLFDLLEEHAETLLAERLTGRTAVGDAVGREVIRRAVDGMLRELQPNLWERNLERRVDYGHSFSPTLEMRALPALLHGEAVSVDMALTTIVAERRGLISAPDRARVFNLMKRLRLPVWHPLCGTDLLAHALRETTRHRDGLQRIPLPVGIGDARFVSDLTHEEVTRAAEVLRDLDLPTRAAPRLSDVGGHGHPIVTDVYDIGELGDVPDGAEAAHRDHVIACDASSVVWESIRWSSLPPGAACVEKAPGFAPKLYFILAGEGELLLGEESHPLRPGHLVVAGPSAVHHVRNHGADDLNWLLLEFHGLLNSTIWPDEASAGGGVA
ncbi:2-epi-5-epi-valiolone synthase (partial match) [Frankia alni ACN14a]|uniref:2-epi-5-epi-valiolone synthase n=1 Tax=Frankia alni (strain DSM 45986 / CECT 9034 / ACN14a) TaxID=326424 RepID=Q0RGV5_FRAAA|nr:MULTISPECIES: sedoheptulose 7-phosphate cyclase [unclassified Frankia]CAJ63281.1 2-epi-5-epi-valiolone synthase (partial match) [Frankia alni ACN14a]